MKTYTTGETIRLHNTVVALGKFDGIHAGHQILLHVLWQERSEYSPVLFSFDTANVFHKDVLTTREERQWLAEQSGVEHLIFYPVTHETMNMEPEAFISQILCEKLDAKVVVTGEDFMFGKGRRGDVNMLKKYSAQYGYKEVTVPAKLYLNEKISSSRIKNLIETGNLEDAEKMLGYKYFIMGKVNKGRQIGRSIGIRTINLKKPDGKVLPPNGVYATYTVIEGKTYKSITNIGINPTVTDENQIVIETNIFDFDQDVYDKTVQVYFRFFIREEQKFESLEKLRAQIEIDVQVAQNT